MLITKMKTKTIQSMKMKMIASLTTVKSTSRKEKIKDLNKSDCYNKNNNKLLTQIGAISINLISWSKTLLHGFQLKRATKTQCKSFAKLPYVNSTLTLPSEIGSSSPFTPHLNYPANHAIMSIHLQAYVLIVKLSWTVSKSFNIPSGKWCSKKEGTFTVMAVKESRKDTWRNVLVEVSGLTESILWTGYLIPPENSPNGTLWIKSLTSWELTNFIQPKNDPQIS